MHALHCTNGIHACTLCIQFSSTTNKNKNNNKDLIFYCALYTYYPFCASLTTLYTNIHFNITIYARELVSMIMFFFFASISLHSYTLCI